MRYPAFPLILLLSINLTIGLLTFRNYGLSWDEPLFYDYADSIQLAYTPQAFSPSFDFEQVYGPSATDHKYYGPAYVLATQPIQQAVMALLNADRASAWHLVNFLAFQLGLIFFYRLVRRWCDPWPAAAATAFFAWQPVLWGHAFINPKDSPFMVFFLAAVTLGFEMVDSFSQPGSKPKWALTLLAGATLGATAAVRVIGPLAGLVILVYFILQKNWRAIPAFLAYGLVSIVTMFILWPFLWGDPVNRLLEVLGHMSYNPTELAVLFMGEVYRADTLPRRYLPQMLATTLTEPVWLLFAVGLALAIYRIWWKKESHVWPALIALGWFVLMLGYVLAKKPPMYDGFRHFLFTIPPIFIIISFVFQFLCEKVQALPFTHYILRNTSPSSLFAAIITIILIPGLWGISQLHPYEYTYYNTLTGSTGGVYRAYETDYWLTCYKESLEWVRANQPGRTIHIQRELPLAAYYGHGMPLKDLGLEAENDIQPGDLLIFSTRANLDIRSIYRKLPIIHTIGRAGAEFCLIKQKPSE